MTIWFWRSFNPPVRRLPQVSHFVLTLASGRFLFYRSRVLEPHNLQSTQIATSSRLFVYGRDVGYAKRYPLDSELCVSFREYSRTSRKLPPKMRRLSGRLREVVVYEKRTLEVSSETMSGHIYFMEDNLLDVFSK